MTFDGKSEPDVEQMCWFGSLFFLPNGNIYSQTAVITLTENGHQRLQDGSFSPPYSELGPRAAFASLTF